MATKTKAEVATAEAENTAVSAFNEDLLAMAMQDSGQGTNELGMDDVAVPYLYLLQSGSPQVNPDSDAYIEGALPGMFYNNVEEEVYEGRNVGLRVIPCAYERRYVEWVDRDSGGGYVRDHDINSNIMSLTKPDEKGRPHLENGNIIVETAYHYVYFQHPETGTWGQIIIPMKSTQLKKSRRWNKSLMSTLIPGTQKTAPRWLFPYQLKSVKEQKGNDTYSNVDLERIGEPVSMEMYMQCKAFADLFDRGLVVKGDETAVAGAAGDAGDGGQSKNVKGPDYAGGDDEIPF